jgi:predicted AAA+ superfamily ATPase
VLQVPNFLVYNTSLLTAGFDLSLGEASSKPEIWGRWIESAIGAHLLNHRIKGRYSLYYWRDGNDEVDFVLVYKGK